MRERVSEGELLAQETAMFYPPRFDVSFFSSTRSSETHIEGSIQFGGATKNLAYDIFLDVGVPGQGIAATARAEASGFGPTIKRKTLSKLSIILMNLIIMVYFPSCCRYQ